MAILRVHSYSFVTVIHRGKRKLNWPAAKVVTGGAIARSLIRLQPLSGENRPRLWGRKKRLLR